MRNFLMNTSAMMLAPASEIGNGIAIADNNDQVHTLGLVNKAGKQLSDLIGSLITKSEEVDAGPVSILATLRLIFNPKDKDGDETDNLSDEFPRLNTSSIKGDDDYIETNGYTERYEAPVTKPGEDTKIKKLNFFTEFYNATEIGQAQLFVIDQCKLAMGTNRDKAQQLYKDMENVQLGNLLEKTKAAHTKGRSLVRKAAGLWQCIRDLQNITDAKGEVVCTLEESANSATANSKPYDLVNWEKQGRQGMAVKVADVMRLDPAAARAEGGSFYNALTKQLARDTSNTKNKKYPVCENPEMVYDAVAAFVNYFDANPDAVTGMMERMAKKKGGEEYIQMIGKGIGTLKSIWTKPMEIRYARGLEAQIEHGADEAEAA